MLCNQHGWIPFQMNTVRFRAAALSKLARAGLLLRRSGVDD